MLGLLVIAGCALNEGISPTISAVDIDGTWKIVSPVGLLAIQGNCGIKAQAFKFKADGNTLTGTVRSPDRWIDLEGIKIQGDKISFKISSTAMESFYKEWLYKGVVKGDEIKLNCRSAAVPFSSQRRDPRYTPSAVRVGGRLTLKLQ